MSRKSRKANRPPPRTEIPLRTPLSTRRLWIALGGVLAVALAAVLTVARRMPPDGGNGSLEPLPAPTRPASDSSRAGHDDFVGSEACATCHRAEFDQWARSTHAAAGGPPGRVTLIAPFDGTPIRFRDAVVIPERRGAGARFVVRQDGRPEVVFEVDGVVGGGHMVGGGTQGFVSRLADGTVRFLPFDFIRKEGTWFCNTNSRANRGWLPITPDLRLAECGDWPPVRVMGDELRFANCQSCHGSQVAVTLDAAAGGYRTQWTSLGINCESCHGPGRAHLRLVRDSAAVARGAIGMEPLATRDKDGSLETCWQCHALKDQLAPGFRSGQPLAASYSIHLPQLGDEAHLPDGRVRTFAYQQGHLYSDCYVNGGMTCTSCHNPHSQGYQDAFGAPIPGRDDDRQCTSCHAAKAAAAAQHTRHQPGSPGSRCVACHMPYLQEAEVGKALRYARSDHAIPIPRPRADSALGITSACRGCHQDRSESQLDTQVSTWWGEVKPVAPTIAAVLRGRDEPDRARAAVLLLDPAAPHTAALYAGMARFVDRHLGPDLPALERDVVRRLTALAGHRDLDVQALALAALHLARGRDTDVRRTLAERLRAAGPRESALRARWAVALGYIGDKRRAAGDPAGAALVFDKALEVQPGHPRLHLNRGLALADANRLPEAIAAYRASLAADGAQPLALVNLGIAFAATGDGAAAEQAYRDALTRNPREPLAHFNLGNLQLERGELAAAEASYRAAIAADPSTALAHFYLARILAQRGLLREALASVDAGLEFDAANAEAIDARRQLQGLLARRGPAAR